MDTHSTGSSIRRDPRWFQTAPPAVGGGRKVALKKVEISPNDMTTTDTAQSRSVDKAGSK